MDVILLQNRLGHTFKDATLLQQALTHRSHSTLHNERLEFLGDSILNCVVASLLFDRYSKIDEGDLSRVRANLVKQQSLYEIAQRLELSHFLRLGEGELKSGGFRRPSILADTLEALFGAIFLDAGFNVARDAIRALYIPILDTVDPKTLGKDAKTLLQEYLQGKKIALPQYNVVATHGAAHNQEFEIECLVPKLEIQVFGTGGSRRAGEQAAAKLALEAVQHAFIKSPGTARKSKPRTSQLKLAGIATIQPDAPAKELLQLKHAAIKEGKNEAAKASKMASSATNTCASAPLSAISGAETAPALKAPSAPEITTAAMTTTTAATAPAAGPASATAPTTTAATATVAIKTPVAARR
ncbi:ribonuclease III [Glaciimonas immobilis]|uniref:Ribonuclease 3 n=1 Tax=Glaciimonas immobilis TaxID=728004 RepID=A0A840RRM3_9BURK|nr:ribonuclease III [Glaciimonas immobilis]KAF3997966.1 ribonuclease III [Glaciimonas immobilis]MBB5199364.1 ribonuclease-3 [Glaciimonas immobilis]